MQIDLTQNSLPILQALASDTRIKIIEFIGNDKKSVGEIANFLHLSNAITSRHIQQLEDAYIVESERGTGKNRNKKMIYLKVDDLHILFPEKIYRNYSLNTFDLKIGHFTDFSIEPTCGLATPNNIVGKNDDAKSFLMPERVDASLLWFSKGFIEYKIPNLLPPDTVPELMEIRFEVASEFPLSNNVWPSDISIFVNDIRVAVYTVPGNFSDVRGRYTPSWWNDKLSQYGLLKHIRINKIDTGIDGEYNSDVTIDDLNLHNNQFIKLRFSVEEDAVNQGGLTLFGSGFGNHNQDIKINTYYLEKQSNH